jgi:hypothetical protein
MDLHDLILNRESNRQRRLDIESEFSNAIKEAAKFTGIPEYKAPEYNYSSRIVHRSEDYEHQSKRDSK